MVLKMLSVCIGEGRAATLWADIYLIPPSHASSRKSIPNSSFCELKYFFLTNYFWALFFQEQPITEAKREI